jgi:hypothetical protein
MSDESQDFLGHWPKPAQVVSLGHITLNTPALAICDPVGLAETEPSNRAMFIDAEFPVGEAEISVKKWSIGESLYTAFLVIKFSNSEIAAWERAEKVGGANPYEEFEIDYGTAGFMSEEMRTAFMSKAAEYKNSAYGEWLWPFIEGREDVAPDIAKIPLPSGQVFKAVSAPGGNGAYCAFIGRGPDGAIGAVALDLISPALEIL